MKLALALLVISLTVLPCKSFVPADGTRGWAQWSAWSTCSKTCGQGTKTRTHFCENDAGPMRCFGPQQQTTSCSLHPCGWSRWSSWSTCWGTSSKQVKSRARICHGPASLCLGQGCQSSPCKKCKISKATRYTTKCGFLGLGRCTCYRTTYSWKWC